MKTIEFENRAWKGTRLHSIQPIVVGDKEYSFEISFHYPKNQYCVEVSYTYFHRQLKDTYGSIEFFGNFISDCFEWIEMKFNVKTRCSEPIKEGVA